MLLCAEGKVSYRFVPQGMLSTALEPLYDSAMPLGGLPSADSACLPLPGMRINSCRSPGITLALLPTRPLSLPAPLPPASLPRSPLPLPLAPTLHCP
jgi:hypothetical protein